MARFRKVVVGPKVDLDTCGVLLCALCVGSKDYAPGAEMDLAIEVARTGRASEADLADASVLCIEVGGAGRMDEGNFDHHEAGGPSASATKQAYDDLIHRWPNLGRLVDYINRLDTEGPQAFGARKEGIYLSSLFAGMLLMERDPVMQVREGVHLLSSILFGVEHFGWDPFEPLPEGAILGEAGMVLPKGVVRWVEAKRANDRTLAETITRALWVTTLKGRRLAWLESNFFGAPGALYAHGAEIAVVFNPRFGNPPVRKFTVAGNSVVVAPALERLNALEFGWGGPATGTILGSPREGSSLTLGQVVEVVRETL